MAAISDYTTAKIIKPISRPFFVIIVFLSAVAALAGMVITGLWLYQHALEDADSNIRNATLTAIKSVEADLAKEILFLKGDLPSDLDRSVEVGLALIEIDADGVVSVDGGNVQFVRQIRALEENANLFSVVPDDPIVPLDVIGLLDTSQTYRALAIRYFLDPDTNAQRFLVVKRRYFADLLGRLMRDGHKMTLMIADTTGALVASAGTASPSLLGKPIYLEFPGAVSGAAGKELQHIESVVAVREGEADARALQQTLAVRGGSRSWPLEVVSLEQIDFGTIFRSGLFWIFVAALPGALFLAVIGWYLGTQEYELKEENEDQKQRIGRFSEVLALVQTGILDWDLRSGSIYFTDPWLQMLGYAAERHYGRTSAWHDRIHQEDRERVLAKFNEAIDQGKKGFEQKYRLESANGDFIQVNEKAHISRDKKGAAERILIVHSKIS